MTWPILLVYVACAAALGICALALWVNRRGDDFVAKVVDPDGPYDCICEPGFCTGDLRPEDLGDPTGFCGWCAPLDPYEPCPNDNACMVPNENGYGCLNTKPCSDHEVTP